MLNTDMTIDKDKIQELKEENESQLFIDPIEFDDFVKFLGENLIR